MSDPRRDEDARDDSGAVAAERGLVSCLLNYTDLVGEEGLPGLQSFVDPQCRKFVAAIFDLYEQGTEISPATVASHPSVQGELTPLSDLMNLQDLLPTPETWTFYAARVKEEADNRSLEKALRSALRKTLAGSGRDARRILARELEQAGESNRRVRTWGELHTEVAEMAEKRYLKGGEDPGVTLPWFAVNRLLGGFGDGDLAVVAGIPGGGKTVFALQVAEHAALLGTALVFSLEMRGVDLASRAIVRRLRIDGHVMSVREVQGGRFSSQGAYNAFARITGGEARTARPLIIDDTPSQTVAEIARRARSEHRKAQERGVRLSFLAVDYSQLIEYSGQHEKAHQEISEAAKKLKGLARELDCCVLLLAQLDAEGMAIVSRGGTPGLANIAGSKDIGKHCDSLTYILWELDPATKARSRNRGTFYVDKNRQGGTGSVPFYFDGEKMEFTEVDNR